MQSDEEPYLNRHQSLWNDPTFKKNKLFLDGDFEIASKESGRESLETNPST